MSEKLGNSTTVITLIRSNITELIVFSQTQINNLIKKLDIANVKEHDPCIDYMAAVKDGHLKEILAKEILTYDPPAAHNSVAPVLQSKLENLMKVNSVKIEQCLKATVTFL